MHPIPINTIPQPKIEDHKSLSYGGSLLSDTYSTCDI